MYKLFIKKINDILSPIFIAGDINDRPIQFKNKYNQLINNINMKKGPNCNNDEYNKYKRDINYHCSFIKKINKTFPTKKNTNIYKNNINSLIKKHFSNKAFKIFGFNERVDNKGVNFLPTYSYKKGFLNSGSYLDNIKISKKGSNKTKKEKFNGKNIGYPDRIFYKGNNIKCIYYNSIIDIDTILFKGYKYSDHLPVMDIYTLNISKKTTKKKINF